MSIDELPLLPLKLIERYETSADLEENGTWVTLEDGIEVKLCREGSERWTRTVAEIMEPYTEQLAVGKKLSKELNTQLTCRIMAHALVLDWRGDLVNGTPYTPEVGEQAFMQLRDLSDQVARAAQSRETFRNAELVGLAGNSERPSPPSLSEGQISESSPKPKEPSPPKTPGYSRKGRKSPRMPEVSGGPTGDSETLTSAPNQ